MFETLNEYNQSKDHKIGTYEMVEHCESVPDCYNNQQICDAAVDNYPLALKFVSYCYMTEKIHEKDVNTNPSTIQFLLECYKTQEMCDKAVRKIR